MLQSMGSQRVGHDLGTDNNKDGELALCSIVFDTRF